MDIIIGSHVSFKKEEQLMGSLNEALSYGANTFMFYTGAPQNTARYPINDEITNKALQIMKEKNIDINNIVVHAPYIVNLANINNFDFNIKFLKEEVKRVESLTVSKLVLHPGSHVGFGIDIGIQNIIDSLNEVINEDTKVIICLETMAGKGTELGKSFEELKQIIDGINFKDKIGVCLDTCHINDAGYDLNNFDTVLAEFDKIIGLSYLKVVHINDSKNDINAHKDRHANLGFGTIGFNTLLNIIYHDKLKGVPKILETPYVDKNPPYKLEIEMIRQRKFDSNLLEKLK